jgi:nucleotide-binding universal stress UspA family protein
MYRNLLIPVSFEEDHKTDQALRVAAALTETEGKVTLLHVMEQIPGYAASYLPDGYREDARKSVEQALRDLAGDLPHAEGVVVEGRAGSEILGWAAEHAADCIVIPSHRPGSQNNLLGSTAAQVVRHAACSVHVVR